LSPQKVSFPFASKNFFGFCEISGANSKEKQYFFFENYSFSRSFDSGRSFDVA
jgi:hypothetical protein